MSRNARIGLVAAALVVAVVGFLIASPGADDDESDGGQAAQTAPAETAPDAGGETAAEDGTATEVEAETETEAEQAPPPEPEVTRIRIRDGQVVGGPKDITVTTGDVVRIVVSADAPDEIHLHGYDVTRNAAPGSPARFRVEATLEGAFEIESHTAGDAGLDPLVGRLTVEPS